MSAARQFTKVSPDVWASRRFRQLKEPAKVLLLYLMTCRHQNSSGAFRAPLGYLCADLGWADERVMSSMADLIQAGLVSHDEVEEEFFVHGWFRYNPPMNSKHATGTQNLIGGLKSERLSSIVAGELETAIAADPVVSEAVSGRSKLTETAYMRNPGRNR